MMPAIDSKRAAGEKLLAGEDRRLHVLIADPDGLARRMMQTALQEAGIVMVTSAHDGREALELARYYRPTVLLVDLALPPAGGVELVPKVLEVSARTRIVTVAVDDDEGALAALRAGAVGHISKDIRPAELAGLVAKAARGEPIVAPRLVLGLLELVREMPDAGWRPLRSRLTTREWEIVEHLAEGASTDRIAERLVLSPTTVYSHIKRLMRKLDVHSRRDAVAVAERLRREEAVGKKLLRGAAPDSPPRPFDVGNPHSQNGITSASRRTTPALQPTRATS